MLCTLALLASLVSMPKDLITAAIKSYEHVASYQATLRVSHGRSKEIIRYFFKKPGFVRMEFIKPHKGAWLLYDPTTNQVRLQPFGNSKVFGLTLSPDNALVKSASGHRVDETDIGTLLERVRQLKQQGHATNQGEERLGERTTILVDVVGNPGVLVDGASRFLLNLDPATLLPLQVRTFDAAGRPLETVLMDDLQTDVAFADGFFNQ
ncbi:MAG: LolA family protein [Acidobacteriota bacterium]